MLYSATAYRLLVSAPSDIPQDDIDEVIDAVIRWNAIYGQGFGAVVVPTHWQRHSAAEHGSRPQASLNAQLVERADVLLALFWHRLGSPTGEAASGTAEEIQKAHENGAYVAILRCGRDIPQSGVDPAQITKLREFYDDVAPISLMLSYQDAAELSRHVDAILSRAVTRDSTLARAAVTAQPSGADVWPRIESSEQVKTDTKGRIRTSRRWRLVLSNSGTEPAHDVRYRLEPESEGDVLPFDAEGDQQNRRALEVLPPGGQAPYPLFLHTGVSEQARCVVTWNDSRGERENRATLRFY